MALVSADFCFVWGLWFFLAEESAELVDGVRSVTLAAPSERSRRIGEAAAAGAGEFGLKEAGCRAADVWHELRARRSAVDLQRHLEAAVFAGCRAAAKYFADVATGKASGHGTRRGCSDVIVH